jgi:acetate kinase
VQRVTPDVLAAMEEMNLVAPAHNPPYIRAMRLLGEKLPEIPLVAAFETGFHNTIPDKLRLYAAPHEWAEKLHIKRWGFHGASHRYIAQRTSQLLGRYDLRIISCHLGGSNSLCAIRGQQSVATTLGMSPQTGLPHNNRVGDFDPFCIPLIMQAEGKSLQQVLDTLAEKSGLLGLSGISGDVRDLEEAAAAGNGRARLALDVFIAEIRRHLGGMLVELGGCDAIVFTGGIGENGVNIRAGVCENLQGLGIELDSALNSTKGDPERCLSTANSKTQIWVVPTNEELVVARQTKHLLEGYCNMFVAKVTGSLVSTQKVETMKGFKLLIVEPYRIEAKERKSIVTTGRTFVAVDTLGAGIGDFVILTQGSSARLTPETKTLPIDAVVVGIVDKVQVDEGTVYSRD